MIETIERVIIVDKEDNEIGIFPRNKMRAEKKIHRGSYVYVCDSNCKYFILVNFYV